MSYPKHLSSPQINEKNFKFETNDVYKVPVCTLRPCVNSNFSIVIQYL